MNVNIELARRKLGVETVPQWTRMVASSEDEGSLDHAGMGLRAWAESQLCPSISVMFWGEHRTPEPHFPHCLHCRTLFKRKTFFRQRGKKGERERNINAWMPLMRPLLGTWNITQVCALTGNRTSDPLVWRPVLNPLSHTSQGWRTV